VALCQPQGRQVARSIAVEALAGEGKNHPRREDAIFLHQHRPVMERRVAGKDIEQQFHGKARVNVDARVEKIFGPKVVAQIQHDQRSAARLGKQAGGLGEHGHRTAHQLILATVGEERAQITRSEEFHETPQFALPEDGEGEAAGQHEGIDELGGEGQGDEALNKPGQGHQQEVAPKQPEGPGVLEAPEEQNAKQRGKKNIQQKENEIPVLKPKNHNEACFLCSFQRYKICNLEVAKILGSRFIGGSC
jgi:hypothetical protein